MKQELIHRLWKLIFKIFRKKRFAMFVDRVRPQAHEKILDVGGYPSTWEGNQHLVSEIHIVNVHPIDPPAAPGNLRFLVADGCAMPQADGAFDIVFSNSVIEHVGDFERQKAFASEMLRLGGRLWVQTPAQEFWIEPHYMTPFIHWLPVEWRLRVARNFSVWGWLTRPNAKQVSEFVHDIRLLTHAEMVRIFPGCEILREKVCLGLFTKSYIAVRTP